MSVSRYTGWLWLASSLPIGLLILLVPEVQRVQAFAGLLAFDLAHSVSPVVMAWSRPEMRRVLLARPAKYLGWPAALLLLALAVGLATSLGYTSYRGGMFRITDWRNPYPILMWAYAAWNIWHFGLQHYGALALWRRPQDAISAKTACMGLSAGWMLAAIAMFGTTAGAMLGMTSSVNHWVVEIGLGWRVMRYRWRFLAGIMVVGVVWAVVTHFRNELIPLYLFPLVMCLRLIWAGGTHFLYSGWSWGRNSPIRQQLTLVGA